MILAACSIWKEKKEKKRLFLWIRLRIRRK